MGDDGARRACPTGPPDRRQPRPRRLTPALDALTRCTTFRGREAGELHALVAHLRTALPGLLREHNVRTVIDSVFDLTAADHAAERLTRSGLTGKVILRITRR
ncbi:hypothetical protein QR77_19450 [Streptomyces sp. 150FB]|nr:hypothetical protein QR77_19450 [Streptomyces sp. 150FB]